MWCYFKWRHRLASTLPPGGYRCPVFICFPWSLPSSCSSCSWAHSPSGVVEADSREDGMPVQEAMIARLRDLCLQDERVVAALLYGSFTRGEGDAFSDIEA